jgi:hypothetical protein
MSALPEQFANHLEFLGYQLEKREPKEPGKPVLFLATHPKHWGSRFWEFEPYFVLFVTGIQSPRTFAPEMTSFLNKLNERMVISKAYCEGNDQGVVIKFESVYTGIYKKDLFSSFYEMKISDEQRLHQMEDCDKIFK